MRLWEVDTGRLKATLGHPAWVTSVVFSPDGKTLASFEDAYYSDDDRIRLWGVDTGRLKATLEGHTDWVTSVVFSPDGKTLASASADHTVRLWDAHTGQLKATLEGHTSYVYSVVISPDGKTLASSSADGTVRLWEGSTGQLKTTLEGESLCVAFSPDGTTLAIVSSRESSLWDVETEQLIYTFFVREIPWYCAFSPDGETLAISLDDYTVDLWEVATGQRTANLRGTRRRQPGPHGGEKEWAPSMAFSPDGKTLVSASADDRVRLWDVETAQLKATLEGHSEQVNSVAFSPDGKTLASAGEDHTVRLWDWDRYSWDETDRLGTGTRQIRATLTGYRSPVKSVTFASDGKTLASASKDHRVRLWDVDTAQLQATLEGRRGTAVFSPDGKTLASAGEDYTVRLWEVDTARLKAILEGHTDSLRTVVFSRDGKTLASAGDDRTVRLWEVDTGQIKATLEGHIYSVTSAVFSPDGKTLASVSRYEKKARLWEADTGELKATFGGPSRSRLRGGVVFSPDGITLALFGYRYNNDRFIGLWDLATGQPKARTTIEFDDVDEVGVVVFSPDGETLALGSGGLSAEIWFWDLTTGQLRNTLNPGSTHGERGNYYEKWPYAVRSVQFSQDGTTLASGGGLDARLWEVSSGRLKVILKGHADLVNSVAFSPDDKLLASGSDDGTILLWDMSPFITPSVPTAIEGSGTLPARTVLRTNYPNPFNAGTWILYRLAVPGPVELKVFNILGQPVRTLVDQVQTPKSYRVHWDGRDHRGERVANGVYFYRLQAGQVTQGRKMLVLE